MSNTSNRREIKRYTNAKENETVMEATKLVSKAKQDSAKTAAKELSRVKRKDHVPTAPMTDEQAADHMVDEGAHSDVQNETSISDHAGQDRKRQRKAVQK